MINDFLIIIPARGGSKGVPGKNIKELDGKPLIHYTIDAAREIASDNHIIVSTDDQEIKSVVEKFGLKVPFLRPSELSTDTAGSYEVLLHALDFFEKENSTPEYIILLQPTSPFRNEEHIKQALKLYESNLDMIVSVKETASNPYYVLHEENEMGFLMNSKEGNFARRQDCPKVWELNGAIYIINVSSLRQGPISSFVKIKKFVMDEISSHDVDTMLDWKLAEILIKEYKK